MKMGTPQCKTVLDIDCAAWLVIRSYGSPDPLSEGEGSGSVTRVHGVVPVVCNDWSIIIYMRRARTNIL